MTRTQLLQASIGTSNESVGGGSVCRRGDLQVDKLDELLLEDEMDAAKQHIRQENHLQIQEQLQQPPLIPTCTTVQPDALFPAQFPLFSLENDSRCAAQFTRAKFARNFHAFGAAVAMVKASAMFFC